MNALTVLCIAAAAVGSSGQLLGYSGLFGAYRNVFGVYPGVYGAYPSVYTAHHGFLPADSKITLKTIAPTPLTYNVAPLAPVAPVQSQYHAQDELGQYSFGYSGGPSSRAETRDAFGIVRGSYNYIDAKGKIQTQHYVADALGFRVAGTDLPVAPEATAAGPDPVQDTAEVAAAKAVLKKAHDEAAAAAAAAPDTRKKRAISVVPTYSSLSFPYGHIHPIVVGSRLTYTSALPGLTTYGVAPAYTGTHALGYAAVAPVAAALRNGALLRVENNPGHAVSYRVD
nr:cuticle protein 16.8-like [Cherax quadricarinatus]